jgi:pimeloyl-ACP methyl ester carboxylesterase
MQKLFKSQKIVFLVIIGDVLYYYLADVKVLGIKILRMFWWLLGTLGVFYLAIVLLMYFMQARMIYFPSKSIDSTPQQIGLAYEDVYLEAEDGVKIHGWFVPADSARATLLFLHGNGGNISHRLESIHQFHSLNLSVFIIDYHGYGLSQGKPGEQETYHDAEASWKYLTGQKQINPDKIIIFGRSLGGAVASWLAVKHQPRALIMESAFSSLVDIANTHYPFLPVRMMSRFNYDSKENIRRINVPVLFIHSPNDEIIPFKHGDELYRIANEPKQFLEITGSHNDGYLASSAEYLPALDRFIDEILQK